MLEITLKTSTGFINAFAKLMGSKAEDGMVKIPKGKGSGYLRGFMLGPSMGVMIRNYELNEDLLSRRLANPHSNDRIVMSFNNVFYDKGDKGLAGGPSPVNVKDLPSVQMGRGNIDFEAVFPSKTKFRSIVIAIDTERLLQLLDTNAFSDILFNSNKPLLFEELVPASIQKVAQEIVDIAVPVELQTLYIRVKAEELICLFFAALLKRESAPIHALNALDVGRIYRIRDKLLSSLDTPPLVSELAREAGMSESKLKRLFRQIFGNSVFHYYQHFRMQEAGRLLRENKLSVSEVGYELGFTNLSHFTRVFEEHMGMKPKKYALSQGGVTFPEDGAS